MSSQARDSRAEERRLSIRTLAIASASSAIAAIVTSRLWTAGTPIAAAMTPVLVTLLSEMLHRPTAKIAGRFTVETDALPEAMGSGPPPQDVEHDDPEPMREQPQREMPDDVRVYRSGANKRVLHWKLIAATAAAAFVVGVAVLTLPQVIAGQSLLKGNPPGYGSASKKKDRSDPVEEERQAVPTETEQEPDATAPERTTPENTTTTEEPDPRTAPEVTTPAPEEEPSADPPASRTAPQTTPQPAPR